MIGFDELIDVVFVQRMHDERLVGQRAIDHSYGGVWSHIDAQSTQQCRQFRKHADALPPDLARARQDGVAAFGRGFVRHRYRIGSPGRARGSGLVTTSLKGVNDRPAVLASIVQLDTMLPAPVPGAA